MFNAIILITILVAYRFIIRRKPAKAGNFSAQSMLPQEYLAYSPTFRLKVLNQEREIAKQLGMTVAQYRTIKQLSTKLGLPESITPKLRFSTQGGLSISPESVRQLSEITAEHGLSISPAALRQLAELTDQFTLTSNDDGQCCTVSIIRQGKTHQASFSMKDASSERLRLPSHWIYFAKQMREQRAMARCLRMAFVELAGFFIHEEMAMEVDQDGNPLVITPLRRLQRGLKHYWQSAQQQQNSGSQAMSVTAVTQAVPVAQAPDQVTAAEIDFTGLELDLNAATAIDFSDVELNLDLIDEQLAKKAVKPQANKRNFVGVVTKTSPLETKGDDCKCYFTVLITSGNPTENQSSEQISITCYGFLARQVDECIEIGFQATVAATLTAKTWTAKDGSNCNSTSWVADLVTLTATASNPV